jgi:predicted small secreted protein
MRALKVASLAVLAFLLSACVSIPGLGPKVDQSSADAVALAYIEAFYTGDSRTIKRILEPTALEELESDSDSTFVILSIEKIGQYVQKNGGYKNLKITDVKKNGNDTSRTYYYDIDIPYATRHIPTQWRDQSSSIELLKDAQGLWWANEIDGIAPF